MRETDINFNKMVRWARKEGHAEKEPSEILRLYTLHLAQVSKAKRGREASRYRLFTRTVGKGKNSTIEKVFALNSQENREAFQNHGWQETTVIVERDYALLLGNIAESPVSRRAA